MIEATVRAPGKNRAAAKDWTVFAVLSVGAAIVATFNAFMPAKSEWLSGFVLGYGVAAGAVCAFILVRRVLRKKASLFASDERERLAAQAAGSRSFVAVIVALAVMIALVEADMFPWLAALSHSGSLAILAGSLVYFLSYFVSLRK